MACFLLQNLIGDQVDINVSRKGLSAQRIYNSFTSILAETTDSNWSVKSEIFFNAAAIKEEGKDVVEFIAPRSLAYYFAK
jgi:hypothetical protein